MVRLVDRVRIARDNNRLSWCSCSTWNSDSQCRIFPGQASRPIAPVFAEPDGVSGPSVPCGTGPCSRAWWLTVRVRNNRFPYHGVGAGDGLSPLSRLIPRVLFHVELAPGVGRGASGLCGCRGPHVT